VPEREAFASLRSSIRRNSDPSLFIKFSAVYQNSSTIVKKNLRKISGYDELWITSENISAGMQGEIEEAKRLGILIHRFDPVNQRLLEIL